MRHLTDACDHVADAWCVHCEEGCQWCGVLADLDDDSYCEDCAFSRAETKADALYDSWKERD
jgi:hypothetical protein